MIHNLKGRRIFYILAAVLCAALLAGAMLAVNVMAAGSGGSGGGQSTNYGSSPYSGHIDVRLVTGEYTFTQTVDTSTIQSVKVSKVWSDADTVDHSSDSVTVYLTDSTGNNVTEGVTLSEANDWTSTLSDLDLTEGNYYVTEGTVNGYTSSITNNGEITVSGSSTSQEEYTVKVSSLSITGINSTLIYTHNGSTYTITGYTNGSDTESGLSVAEYSFESKNLTLENGDTITVTVSFTVSYTITDSEGNVLKTVTNEKYTDVKYTETVAAHADGYVGNYCHGGGYDFYVMPSELLEDIINEDLTAVTITNTPSTVDIPVIKTWAGDTGYTGIRPSSVTVTVYNGETVVDTLTLSGDNNWSGTFEDLPEYDTSGGVANAEKIEYTVKETAVTGYTTSYSTADNGTITITNTLETVSIPVTKTWNDGNGYYRPSSVTVTLYADDEATSQTLTLNSTDSWSGTFSDLPMYGTDDDGTVSEIKYTVVETAVDNYDSSVTYNTDGSVTITNTLKTATVNLTKTVSGNMGDKTKDFTFNVSYVDENGTTQTATYYLSDEESSGEITVPYGATVTITESDNSGYYVTATVNTTDATVTDGSLSFTVAADSYDVVVDNYKSIAVDTGVVLESIPYIAILAVVVIGGVVLLRRRNRDED